MKRRSFLQTLSAIPVALSRAGDAGAAPRKIEKSYSPGRIPNEYSLTLPGEEQALTQAPDVVALRKGTVRLRKAGQESPLRPGDENDGWQLLAVTNINGTDTAVFEKHAAHTGAIVYVTVEEGVILRVPKSIGSLANIRPRPTNAPHVQFKRRQPYEAGRDLPGSYILDSLEDPCYENVAALGPEYIGYTLVANEEAGPLLSLFLEADGSSRQSQVSTDGRASWAPDLLGKIFDPAHFLPGEDPGVFAYVPGYSKRTLFGGYLPVADTGVWNPQSGAGYEVMVLLPSGEDAKPLGRIRAIVPHWMASRLGPEFPLHKSSDGNLYCERYWNASPESFFSALAGVANRWQHFFEDHLPVDIPDPWLLDSARAGIAMSRCSYRGLEPSYQIGEGAYTKIPERSHALFPVSFYEFVWAHQLWNLTAQAEPYFQNYLARYILPDGNFLYNTQDQVEGPLNVGVFLWNSARAYDYTRDFAALKARLPVLARMLQYVLERYEYSKSSFSSDDRRHGLIWGSPEADLGEPNNDYPNSHPYYFQNAAWIWRGCKEHARCLALAGKEHDDPELLAQSKRLADVASEMRTLIERSLQATAAAANPAMREAGIAPFDPFDINHQPEQLSSYENHRFMMDWFTADWGNPALDLGHLKHRELAGCQIMGLHTDGEVARTSNFMEHGTLAVRIRQDDYRPFLLTLYSLCCYAADSGNRYSPEDAYIPGGRPGEGSPYGWSAVVNSVLQPALGLRWLLCYEESDKDLCHLQKAAPQHWFSKGKRIAVKRCPTRFGVVSWSTEAVSDTEWIAHIEVNDTFGGDIWLHIHPPERRTLSKSTLGDVRGSHVLIRREELAAKSLTFHIHA